MRPFTVLIGIILGCAASFTFGLGTVLIVFLVLGPQHPELPRELPRVAGSLAAFAILTVASAGSFLGEVEGPAVARLGASGDRYLPGWPDFAVLAAPQLSRQNEPHESQGAFYCF